MKASTSETRGLDRGGSRPGEGRASARFFRVGYQHSRWSCQLEFVCETDARSRDYSSSCGAPIAALAGATRSRVLNRDVDVFGDALQNIHAHGTRHNKPLQKWLACFRAV